MTGDERLARERALFLGLLHASRSEQPRALLAEALAALVDISGSRRGYLEVLHPVTSERFSLQQGCTDDEAAHIRSATSRGIVTAALESGTVIQTSSAQLDPRFNKLESVRSQQLEAVLCVPVPGQPVGVLYLERRRGAGPFAPDDVALASEVAQAAGPMLSRAATFLGVQRDATAPVRQRLKSDQVIGRSEALARVLERVALAAPLDVTVLITGEPGTGKTQLARLLHDNSRRAAEPFVELNCAALQDTLVESELFGTTQGAYTGARTTAGKVEAASGGTLFLDEVGELSPSAQAKLLQLLQSKQFYAVGSTRLQTANVRLLSATNANLEEQVAAGKFREDLLYRLNVLPIRMPSLRERPEDIELLVADILSRVAHEHGLPHLQASPALRTLCELEPWPGNVRQLRNKLETALICAAGESAAQVEPRHFDPARPRDAGTLSYSEATRAFQREFLVRQLAEVEGNRSELARRLDLSRAHVHNLLKLFHLNP